MRHLDVSSPPVQRVVSTGDHVQQTKGYERVGRDAGDCPTCQRPLASSADARLTHLRDGNRWVHVFWHEDGAVDEYRTFGRLID
ncbi:Uncharacterised protein [Mycobacteroides abscessus]|nr:Uncharacterised protein [Mycobacteroides abscessus]